MSFETHEINSASRQSTVDISVLLPDGYDASGDAYPLILQLHGGGGNRHYLADLAPIYQQMISDGTLPPCIVASLSAGASMYVGFEDFVAHELPDWIAKQYNARSDRDSLCLIGTSMGGFGTLYIGLSHPERFCAIAGLEPAIEPGFEAEPPDRRNTWWRNEAGVAAEVEHADGEGMNWDFAEVSPARIVRDSADAVRASRMEIYVEVGDEDYLNLQDGAEFLHRVLWDHDIRHEYHLVRWADHVGVSTLPRMIEGHRFLAGALAGGRSENRDMDVPDETMEKVLAALRDPDNVNTDPEDSSLSDILKSEYGPTVHARMHGPMRATAMHDPEMKRSYAKLPPTR